MKIAIIGMFLNKMYNHADNMAGWYDSLKKLYMPECERVFAILSDNKKSHDIFSGEECFVVDVDPSYTRDTGVNKLLKFSRIKKCLDVINSDVDYICFVQSNARCVSLVNIEDMVGEKGCDISVCSHCCYPAMSFRQLYYNKHGSSVDITGIDTSRYVYVYSGHFVSKVPFFNRICKMVCSSIDSDFSDDRFREWYPSSIGYSMNINGHIVVYDETYFNYHLNKILTIGNGLSVNVVNGNIFCHGYYSSEKNYKIDMIDKRKMICENNA